MKWFKRCIIWTISIRQICSYKNHYNLLKSCHVIDLFVTTKYEWKVWSPVHSFWLRKLFYKWLLTPTETSRTIFTWLSLSVLTFSLTFLTIDFFEKMKRSKRLLTLTLTLKSDFVFDFRDFCRHKKSKSPKTAFDPIVRHEIVGCLWDDEKSSFVNNV